MRHIKSYHNLFESEAPITKEIWDVLDRTAERIASGEGYGKPLDDLIKENPMFAIERYGKILCDTDVLFDRFHKLKQKNQVLKNISFAERMVMLLSHWHSLEQGFYFKWNPKKLKQFSKWVLEPQTLYRGMTATEFHQLNKNGESFVLDSRPFYSFTFLKDVAKKFTIDGYASGHYVPASRAHGFVVETKAKPIDFHVFMGAGLDDEMEVILKGPIEVEITESVGMKQTG